MYFERWNAFCSDAIRYGRLGWSASAMQRVMILFLQGGKEERLSHLKAQGPIKSSETKSQRGLRSSKPRAARAIQMAARKTILGFVAAPCALPGAKRSGRAASRLARACDQRLTLCARRRPCLCAYLLAATFGEVSELAKLNVVLKKTSHHYHLAELLNNELNLVALTELEKAAAAADLRGQDAAAWPLARQHRGSAPASGDGAPGRADCMSGRDRSQEPVWAAVSYTHLTLPTILRV